MLQAEAAYFKTSIFSTRYISAVETKAEWVRLRFCFVVFFVRIWLLKACFLLIFPVPVTLNLFLALECVFVFGMVMIICIDLLVYSFIALLVYWFIGSLVILILMNQ